MYTFLGQLWFLSNHEKRSQPLIFSPPATLVLLLSVSCAIVFRSLLVRRRRNRYIAEAIANGTWIPRGGTLRDPGTTPTLFEARVTDLKHPPGNDELEWDAITVSPPLSLFSTSLSADPPPSIAFLGDLCQCST